MTIFCDHGGQITSLCKRCSFLYCLQMKPHRDRGSRWLWSQTACLTSDLTSLGDKKTRDVWTISTGIFINRPHRPRDRYEINWGEVITGLRKLSVSNVMNYFLGDPLCTDSSTNNGAEQRWRVQLSCVKKYKVKVKIFKQLLYSSKSTKYTSTTYY